MEKIIQLSEYDYDKLVEKAKMTESKIKEEAYRIYKEKGMVSLNLSLGFRDRYGEEDEITLYASAYVSEFKNDKFPLSYEDKQRLIDFTEKRILKYMQKRFGKNISRANYLIKDIEKQKNMRKTFIGLTVIGWVVAATLLIITLLH